MPSPSGSISSQAQTGSAAVASRFTIFTRCESASDRKISAVASASASEMTGAASGAQQAIGASGALTRAAGRRGER